MTDAALTQHVHPNAWKSTKLSINIKSNKPIIIILKVQ